MTARRAQKPIHIRSDRAAARLWVLTRDGRSQAEVIEQALDRMPDPPEPALSPDDAARLERIRMLVKGIPPGSIMSMEEFDALEYDEFGDPR